MMNFRHLLCKCRFVCLYIISWRIWRTHFSAWVQDNFGFWARLALLLALILGNPARAAWAHAGGVPQLTNAEVGPYRVFVWTQPEPPRVGRIDIVVAVAEPADSKKAKEEVGDVVLDALVKVQLQPVDQGQEMLTAFATHEASTNKLYYEAILELPAEGQWQVVIGVEGSAGSGSASFEIQVLPPLGFNWFLLGGLALVLLATGWIILRSKTPGN